MSKTIFKHQAPNSFYFLMKMFSILFLLFSQSIQRVMNADNVLHADDMPQIKHGVTGIDIALATIQLQSVEMDSTPQQLFSENTMTQLAKQLDRQDENGNTELHRAAQADDIGVIQKSFEKGAPLEIANNNGLTPLQVAVEAGKEESSKYLVKLGANRNVKTKDGLTLLHLAAARGQHHLLEWLNKIGFPLELESSDGDTALILAATYKNVNCVEKLLYLGANPNVSTFVTVAGVKERYALLHLASATGQVEVAKLLIHAGADVNIVDSKGLTPIGYAAQQDQLEMLDLLIASGANIEGTKSLPSPLWYAAAKEDNKKSIAKLIQLGANLEATDDKGLTVVHIAAISGFFENVKTLVHAGADIQHLNRKVNDPTPLLSASMQNHFAIVKFLAEHGANVSAACCFGKTPLHFAAETDRLEMIDLLVQLKANIDQPTIQGMTPLRYAGIYGKKSLKKLIALGANVNDTDFEGGSTLHIAAKFGYVETAKLLLEARADIHRMIARDNALSLAKKHGHHQIADLLMAAGATLPPTFIEQIQEQFATFLILTTILITDPVTISILSISVVSSLSYYFVHLCKQQEDRKRRAEFERKTAIKNRNTSILKALNSVTSQFYVNSAWELLEDQFSFKALSQVYRDYEIEAPLYFSIVSKHINLPYPNQKEIDDTQGIVRVCLTDPSQLILKEINAAEMIRMISSELIGRWHASPKYRFIQLKNEISQFSIEIQHTYQKISIIEETIKKSNEIALAALNDIPFILMPLNGVDPLRIKRVSIVLLALRKVIAQFVDLPTESDIDQYRFEQIVILQDQLKKQSNLLNLRLSLCIQDNVTEENVEDFADQYAQLRSIHSQLNTMANAINSAANNLKSNIDTKRGALRDAIYDYNQEQKSVSHMMSRDQAVTHRKQNIYNAPTQVKPFKERTKQKTVRQQSAENIQDQEFITESPKEQGLSINTLRTSSAISVKWYPINKKLTQHIITLGDLLNGFAKRCDQNEILDYKYALLVESLRLFELMKQITFNKTAIHIRNALMHNHRYIDIEILVGFAKYIAHAPSGERTNPNKLEDALRLPENNVEDHYLKKLRITLSKLRESELYQTHALPEEECPTALVYLQTLSYLLADLSSIHLKEGCLLENFPNKVRAIKGILFCIGECQQQLAQFSYDDANIRRFMYCKFSGVSGLASLVKAAKDFRVFVGHGDIEDEPLIPTEDEIQIEAKQLDRFRLQALAMKQEFDAIVFPETNANIPVNSAISHSSQSSDGEAYLQFGTSHGY